MKKTSLRTLLSGLALAMPAAAIAADGEYADAADGYTALPVRDRPKPDYDPIGVRSGAFIFYPSVMERYIHDSNVFAAPSAEVSDDIFVFSPRLLVEGEIGRHTVTFNFGVDDYRYVDNTSENRTDAFGEIKAVIEASHDLNFTIRSTIAHRHELRDDTDLPSNAAEPAPYMEYSGAVAANKQFNRVGVSLGVAAKRRDYDDIAANGGGTIDQDPRDADVVSAGGRVTYDLMPGYRAFADLRGNWRRYRNAPGVNFDSDGIRALAGVEFAITNLIQGELGAGYIAQDYVNPIYADVSDFSYSASLIWSPTPLMTVTIDGERLVSDSNLATVGGRIDSTLRATLDYEVMRNFIVSPHFEYRNERYADIGRTDDVYQPGISADYYVNRYLRLGGAYDYTVRESSISINDFRRHTLSAHAKAQF